MAKKDETMTPDPNAAVGASVLGDTGPQEPTQSRYGQALGPDAAQMRLNALDLSSRLPHENCKAWLRSAKLIEAYITTGAVEE